ncbi:MAG TPA: DUF2794 domain-containing protein [Kiloniellales bacterium]|jgi:hypothetical protein
MSKVTHLDTCRAAPRATFFNRRELNQLLSLYSRQVASGEWRDYAIDQRGGSAVFSVFRHSHAAPAYRIAKCTDRPDLDGEYVVSRGRETLKQAATMAEVLSIFGRRLSLIS